MNNIQEDLDSLIGMALDKKWVDLSVVNLLAAYLSQNKDIHWKGMKPETIFACADEMDTMFHERWKQAGMKCLLAAHDAGDCLHYNKESYHDFSSIIMDDLHYITNAEVRLLCGSIIDQHLHEYGFEQPFTEWLDRFTERLFQLLVRALTDMARVIIEERAKFKE